MENNWPETIDELMEECQMLVSKTDLYELGERGEPFTGESEPRVDGTDYLAGEYQYGVAMIPAQWVTYVLGNATLGSDDDYEAKMDALLCRLTNGKWSKSRAYDLDFMVSCIDEEYEKAYADELAVTTQGATEIVRCRDCLNYSEGLITDDNEREPSYCCHWKREYIREDGFCSYAERMK